MTNKIIPSDVDIQESLVVSLLETQFNLRVASCVLLGEGFDNKVFLINNHVVFRFPRRREAIKLIRHELMVLPKLSERLPLTIPKPLYQGKPSDLFNRPFYGYEYLPGKSGCAVTLTPPQYESLAHTLGHFLKELHAINPLTLDIPLKTLQAPFDRTNFPATQKNLKERLKTISLTYDIKPWRQKIADICAQASQYAPDKSISALVHGDLYHRHLLFNQENQLTCVIDWGDTSISHPVADLGVLFQFLPKAYHAHFLDAYGPIPQDDLNYARYIGLYYAVVLLWFGHDRGDKTLIKTSLWTLDEL